MVMLIKGVTSYTFIEFEIFLFVSLFAFMVFSSVVVFKLVCYVTKYLEIMMPFTLSCIIHTFNSSIKLYKLETILSAENIILL